MLLDRWKFASNWYLIWILWSLIFQFDQILPQFQAVISSARLMDVLAHYADPIKGDVACPNDWSQLWGKSSHGGNTVRDSLGVDLGSKFEDGQGLITTSTSTPLDGEGLESCDKEITIDAADESPLNSTHLSCTTTTCMPSHLISAMKGSRKKQGLKVEKLSVSWASDVYDPPVTSQSHSVSSHSDVNYSARHKKNNRNRHNNKNKAKSQRNGKKAKGSARGGC